MIKWLLSLIALFLSPSVAKLEAKPYDSGMRINFIHVPKCGGITLKNHLNACFEMDDIYPYSLYPEFLKPSFEMAACTPEDVANILGHFPTIDDKVVYGHFPYWFFEAKDPDLENSFFITSLREPVSRVISHWIFKQKSSPLEVVPNVMCKMFCSDVTLTGEALLQDAIQNLEKMDFIIFQDDYENGIKDLALIFNHELDLKSAKNVTNSSKYEKTLSEEVIEKIKELNDLDMRLYDYADKHLRQRGRLNP